MSLSFLLLFLSHLILSAWALGEKRLAPKGQSGPVASDRNPGGASSSRSSGSIASSASSTSSSVSSSSSSSSSAASPGTQGSVLEHSSFQWSPSGRRTGSLYCRVGIGFHLQIYPDGKVNGSHEANMLSKLLALLQKPFQAGGRLEIREGQRVIGDPRPRPAYLGDTPAKAIQLTLGMTLRVVLDLRDDGLTFLVCNSPGAVKLAFSLL